MCVVAILTLQWISRLFVASVIVTLVMVLVVVLVLVVVRRSRQHKKRKLQPNMYITREERQVVVMLST